MTSRYTAWRDRLAHIEASGRTRRLRPLTPTGPVTAHHDGQELLLAASNDYLGLAWDLSVRPPEGSGGSGGSRLITGDRPAHHALESALEELFGRPALVFTSGYQANLAVFASVCAAGDLIASDQLNHASIIDGLRLSKADRIVFPHGQASDIPDQTRLVVVEGLYSMDGDWLALNKLPKAPWLAVDEAHAVGCIGPAGTGVAAKQGVEPDILIGTFGKAYGAAGAFVVGPPELKQLLVNTARSFIYTTGMPEVVAKMALAGLQRADQERRERLAHRVGYFRESLSELGWTPLGDAHIVPLVIGPAVMEVSERLLNAKIFAPGIRWPTVQKGQERIRFTVSSEHSLSQLDQIAEAIGPCLNH
jgi:8-amino-7-oxononanoate synthase